MVGLCPDERGWSAGYASRRANYLGLVSETVKGLLCFEYCGYEGLKS